MNSNKIIISGVLLLGASLSVYADGKPPSSPMFGLATSLAHGNGATGGSCTIFNAGNAAVTVTDLHAEDGEGNVLVNNTAPTNTSSCSDGPIAGKHSCSVNFVATGGAACLATLSPAAQPSNNAKSSNQSKPPSQPAVKMALELADGDGNILAHVDATPVAPPSSTHGNGGDD